MRANLLPRTFKKSPNLVTLQAIVVVVVGFIGKMSHFEFDTKLTEEEEGGEYFEAFEMAFLLLLEVHRKFKNNWAIAGLFCLYFRHYLFRKYVLEGI